jgi:hypothetical protein
MCAGKVRAGTCSKRTKTLICHLIYWTTPVYIVVIIAHILDLTADILRTHLYHRSYYQHIFLDK